MYWEGVLISWAIPAASSPMDSNFCAWANWASIALRWAVDVELPVRSEAALRSASRQAISSVAFDIVA